MPSGSERGASAPKTLAAGCGGRRVLAAGAVRAGLVPGTGRSSAGTPRGLVAHPYTRRFGGGEITAPLDLAFAGGKAVAVSAGRRRRSPKWFNTAASFQLAANDDVFQHAPSSDGRRPKGWYSCIEADPGRCRRLHPGCQAVQLQPPSAAACSASAGLKVSIRDKSRRANYGCPGTPGVDRHAPLSPRASCWSKLLHRSQNRRSDPGFVRRWLDPHLLAAAASGPGANRRRQPHRLAVNIPKLLFFACAGPTAVLPRPRTARRRCPTRGPRRSFAVDYTRLLHTQAASGRRGPADAGDVMAYVWRIFHGTCRRPGGART